MIKQMDAPINFTGLNYILETRQIQDWLFIRWVEPGKFKKSFVKAFRAAEENAKQMNLKGWYCASEKDHTTMHKLIERVGAVPYSETEDEILFKKEFKYVRV